MFYFFFNEPEQVKVRYVDSLAAFFETINDGSSLYEEIKVYFRNRRHYRDTNQRNLSNYDETTEGVRDTYKQAIADFESENKIAFAETIVNKNRRSEKGKKDYVILYRGISNTAYKMIPSAYRDNNQEYEDRFINDIRVTNPDFTQGRTYIDELSALQHYGCPTRLLDLTKNPLVALYFACEDVLRSGADNGTDGAVACFVAKEEAILHSNSDKVLILTALSHLNSHNKKMLFETCQKLVEEKGRNAKLSGQSIVTKTAVKKLYQEITRVANFDKEILCMDVLRSFFVQPPFNNLRIRAQDGLFLLNGLSDGADECALANENKIIAKIMVPYQCKRKILSELDSIGINRRTLFPEISDTIEYLKNKYR